MTTTEGWRAVWDRVTVTALSTMTGEALAERLVILLGLYAELDAIEQAMREWQR